MKIYSFLILLSFMIFGCATIREHSEHRHRTYKWYVSECKEDENYYCLPICYHCKMPAFVKIKKGSEIIDTYEDFSYITLNQ